ncbi:IS3 family transposase [Caproicibacterium amylolyticum]|uniref:IS3 family transposase n=1 Tax=Caproicibacterium amylolyticum TaxID=2766537 RepID=UPI001FECD7F4|nr:IS3 family transposase [Caproicibacterium amylolyticum]
MSTGKTGTRYDEDFKRTLVNLYQSGGKSQAALCKEYGVSITALGRWIKQYSIVETDDGEILTAKQVKDLQKRNAQLEEELLILKKANCHLHATLKQRLEAIHKLRFQHNIKLLCKVLGVNRSTYYKHYNTEPADRTKDNQTIAKLILKIYADYNKRLGAYKITYVLQRDYGINISVGRVYRLMRTLKLPRMSTEKPYKNYKHRDNGECTNHLHQEFNQQTPNIVWASDFTYIKVAGKWYYLCIVMDLFSCKVISWNISGKPDVDLVMTAFKKAYDRRNCPSGLMFHSDRGSQYTAFSFRQLLDSLNVVQSFSKKGYPFDNACCESFFKYLKKEETNRKAYHSLQELQLSIFQYIEGYYNSRRPHGSLRMLTPNEKEELFWNQA